VPTADTDLGNSATRLMSRKMSLRAACYKLVCLNCVFSFSVCVSPDYCRLRYVWSDLLVFFRLRCSNLSFMMAPCCKGSQRFKDVLQS